VHCKKLKKGIQTNKQTSILEFSSNLNRNVSIK